MSQYRGYPIPNLINGVSQQAPQQRRDTQCEEQINCINSPVDGCDARPGTAHVIFHEDEDWSTAFIHDVDRSPTEQYRLVLNNDTLRVFDTITGEEGIVHVPDPLDLDYLKTFSGTPKELFGAITVEDTTFIFNREVAVNMVPRPLPPHAQTNFDGFVHVKAGDYLATYTVHVRSGNTWYSYTFSTPDNSQGSHASQVQPDYICHQLYKNMRDGQDDSPSVGSLGFSIARIGTIIRLRRTGANGGDFDIGGEDGSNQSRMFAFKDRVNRYAQLPPVCFDGTIIQVKGSADDSDLNFYVEYFSIGGGGRRGVWEECPKPGIPTLLNRGSMPHVLISLGPNEFEFRSEIYDPRVAGDAEKKGKDPGFVGKSIEDMAFYRDRVAIITQSSVTWSKASQFYQFFPDTVQTTLDDAPVDVRVASTQIALLKHAVTHAEAMFLWAQKIQFVVESGEEFSERTVEVNATTAFDYNAAVRPTGVGENLVFTSSSGRFSQIWEQFATAQGVNKEANDVTSHVPKYVPAGLRWFTGTTTLKLYAMNSPREPNVIYIYNYFMVGEEKQQSAWNRWIFPSEHNIIHGSFENDRLRLVVQRPDGIVFETLDCSPAQTDPNGTYLTRLDRRVSEEDCTWVHEPAGGDWDIDTTIVTLPYTLSSEYQDLSEPAGVAEALPGASTSSLPLVLTDQPAPRDGYLTELRFWSPTEQTLHLMAVRQDPPEIVGRTVGKITPVTDVDGVWDGLTDTIVYPVAMDIVGSVSEIRIALPPNPDPEEPDPEDPPPIEGFDEQTVTIVVVEPGSAPDTLTLVRSLDVTCRAGINIIAGLDLEVEPGQFLGFRCQYGVFHDSAVPGAAPKWIVEGPIGTDTPIDIITSSPHPNFQVQIRATGRLATDHGKVIGLWEQPVAVTVPAGTSVTDLTEYDAWMDQGALLSITPALTISYGAGPDRAAVLPSTPDNETLLPISENLEDVTVQAGYTVTQTFATIPEGFAVRCVSRAGADYPPGIIHDILEVNGNQLRVNGIIPQDALFYVGYIPTAMYTFSEFHPKDERGVFIYERVQVRSVRVAVSQTSWTRAEVRHRTGAIYRSSYDGRVLGDPTNVLGAVRVGNGTFRIPVKKKVGEFTLTLINDSPFPSQWQAATVDFRPTVRVQRL